MHILKFYVYADSMILTFYIFNEIVNWLFFLGENKYKYYNWII